MNQLANLSRRKSKVSFPIWIVMLVDVTLVNAGFALAFVLRFGLHIPAENFRAFVGLLPFISLLAVLIFAGVGLYSVRRHSYSQVSRLIAVGVGLTFMATMAMAFWERQLAFPRSVFLVAPLFQLVALNLWRSLTLRLERRWHGKKRLLIVGTDQDVKRLLPKVLSLPTGWVDVACIYPPEATAEIFHALPGVDAVLLTEKVAPEIRREILVGCFELGREVFVVPDLYEVLLKKSSAARIGDTPIIEVPEILVPPVSMFVKHSLDFLFAFFGLVVSLLVFSIIGILIKLTSKGAVFYSQERVGRDGRIFKLFKFRTMVADAEKLSGPMLATENDPRITPLGGILRRTRLDELPQLLNILRGEMSLVGPRPERPEFVRQFLEEVPEYRYRYLVKPGLTGLAQVRAKYSTTVHDKLRYDLNYIVNYSFLLDLKILLETVPTVFSGEAAAGCEQASNVDDLYQHFSNANSKTLRL
ncbi:MAG: sugar transferase [Firmicutes bacterium]|nr:sugar transferase [Bacillota bacterium]MCL5992578.1 sugar transferase [Bacillota bacterium]